MSMIENNENIVVEEVNNEQESNALDSNNEQDQAKTVDKNTTQPAATTPTIEFEEKIVEIKRISKTTKGGRVMRFSALAIIGDKKGIVGFGMGKSNEVPDAI